MTAAYRLKGVGWFGACTAVVLGFYLVSLQVAAERKKLEGLNTSIAATQRDIRALETEFDTRANLAQLERWNGDTLALAAPRPAQFVHDGAELASMDARQTLVVGGPEVKTAALIVPSLSIAPSPVAPTSAPAKAVAAPTRMARAAVKLPAAVRGAITRVTSGPEPARVASVRPKVSSPAKPQLAMLEHGRSDSRRQLSSPAKPQVAMLDHKLLSDTTLGDLLARARTEKGRAR